MLSTAHGVKNNCAFAVLTIEFLFGLISDFIRTPFGLRTGPLHNAVNGAWRQVEFLFGLFSDFIRTPLGLRASPLHNAVNCAWRQE